MIQAELDFMEREGELQFTGVTTDFEFDFCLDFDGSHEDNMI